MPHLEPSCDLRFVSVPSTDGQMVQRSYAFDAEFRYEKILDRSDPPARYFRQRIEWLDESEEYDLLGDEEEIKWTDDGEQYWIVENAD